MRQSAARTKVKSRLKLCAQPLRQARKRISRLTNSAVHTCHFTALAEWPRKSASCTVCLSCLKKTSICQRQRYSSATLEAAQARLLVKNVMVCGRPSTSTSASTTRRGPGWLRRLCQVSGATSASRLMRGSFAAGRVWRTL